MSRAAYTAFVAFVACVLTLLAVDRLTPSGEPDGGGVGITLAVVAQHSTPDDCWIAIEGSVYDVTAYIPQHPTAPEVLYEWCGKEATEGWLDKGGGRPHSSRAAGLLPAYFVGVVVDG